MMAIHKATDQQLQAFLNAYNNWSLKENKLHREFIFKDFIQAFGFMTQVAIVAQSADHHPEWFNVYKKVVVDLTTHEAGGITERDFSLATQMEELAGVGNS